VYPGVDLRYYGTHRQFEYDFVVRPGADYHRIRWDILGADSLVLNPAGDLVLGTPAGPAILKKPVCYATDSPARRLHGRYVLLGRDSVAFEVPDYDGLHALVIDPVLLYATYLGGSLADTAMEVAADANGDAFVCGNTSSTDFPATAGALQPDNVAGAGEAFVAKLNPSGTALLYATYLGGPGTNATAIKVDAAGNAYVAGGTSDATFPVTAGAFQTTNSNGTAVAYVLKLNAAGNGLVYSTFLGGNTQDQASDLAVDAAGDAFVVGTILSSLGAGTTFPTTAGAYLAAYTGLITSLGSGEAFVAKINPTGSGLEYCSYLDGTGSCSGNGIAVDGTGDAYVTGTVFDGTYPTTAGAYQVAFDSSYNFAAFLTKLNASGSGLVYSTFLGGQASAGLPNSSFGYKVAVDANLDAYITGNTQNGVFPTTAGAYQTAFNGSTYEPFTAEFNPAGSALVYSTLLGGLGTSESHSVAVDSNGDAYMTGIVQSGGLAPTAGAFQSAYGGASEEAFLLELNPAGSAALYCSYLGGSQSDNGSGIALDPAGNIYVAGGTNGAFPVAPLPGVIQSTYGGNGDGFVAKFGIPSPTFTASPSPTVTPTASPSVTASPSPSPSSTATVTRTASPTPTDSSTRTCSPTASPSPTPAPPPFLLSPHWPNPDPASAAGIWLPYTITAPAFMDLEVFDISGELVRTWSSDPQRTPAGSQERFWDLRNSNGANVASGVYLVRIHGHPFYGDDEVVWEKCAVVR
jgi:hypothetical protein